MTLSELYECIVMSQPSASSIPFLLHLATNLIIQKFPFGIYVSEPLAVEVADIFKVRSLGLVHLVIPYQCSGIAYVLLARAVQ